MIIDEEAYFEHYGTPGMKWGVRRHRTNRPGFGKTDERTLQKRVKKADRINRIVKEARAKEGKKFKWVAVRPKYNVQAQLTPSLRTMGLGKLGYTPSGFIKRINKEYGGHSYQDILAGEGVEVTARGKSIAGDILAVKGAAKLPKGDTVKERAAARAAKKAKK